MEEISSQVPAYGGISYDRLGVVGLQWPCPDSEHPGTPVLHSDGIAKGKGLLSAFETGLYTVDSNPDYPIFVLSGTVTGNQGSGRA